MAFLNLLTLFHGKGVAGAAIFSLLQRGKGRRCKERKEYLRAILGIVGWTLPENEGRLRGGTFKNFHKFWIPKLRGKWEDEVMQLLFICTVGDVNCRAGLIVDLITFPEQFSQKQKSKKLAQKQKEAYWLTSICFTKDTKNRFYLNLNCLNFLPRHKFLSVNHLKLQALLSHPD